MHINTSTSTCPSTSYSDEWSSWSLTQAQTLVIQLPLKIW